jgi:hypothetical protein
MMIAVTTRAPNGNGGSESAATVTACGGTIVVTVEEADDGSCTVHTRRGSTVLHRHTEPPRRPT